MAPELRSALGRTFVPAAEPALWPGWRGEKGSQCLSAPTWPMLALGKLTRLNDPPNSLADCFLQPRYLIPVRPSWRIAVFVSYFVLRISVKVVLCMAAGRSRHAFLLTSLSSVDSLFFLFFFFPLGYLLVPCSFVICPWLQYNHKTFTAKPWRIHMSIWSVRPPRSQGLWGSIRISEGDTCCHLMNRDAEGDSGSHYLGLDNLWWWPGGMCYLNSLELLWIICW